MLTQRSIGELGDIDYSPSIPNTQQIRKLIRVRGGNGPVARETKDPVVACLKKSKGF